MGKVDVLAPPDFAKTGLIKTKKQAVKDENWLGVFHLWIVTRHPVPALIYQVRSLKSTWGPGLLDVTVGGAYHSGENRLDGLREVREEIGVSYDPRTVTYVGKKIFFGRDVSGRMRQSVVDVHLVEDNRTLEQFVLQKSEVSALCVCPLDYLIKLHTLNLPFKAPSITHEGLKEIIEVTPALIPYNWDNYHFKIALLAKRFLRGEKTLVY